MAQTKRNNNNSKKILPETKPARVNTSTDNYNTTSKKIWHFVFGLGNNLIIAILAFVIFFGINLVLYQEAVFIAKILDLILGVGIIILEVVVIKHYYKIGKRYIAIGMICSAILPLLTAGFCSAIMYSNL